jgi:hypothetical protein
MLIATVQTTPWAMANRRRIRSSSPAHPVIRKVAQRAGAKNRTTILDQTLNERVVVTDSGKRKSITKQEAIFKQLVNKAASGDHRAAQLLIGEIREIEARIDSTRTGREIIDEIDQQVFSQLSQAAWARRRER